MSEHVAVETSERITTIRMTRGDKKNALTLAMYDAIADAFAAAASDDGVRAVIVAGVPGAFSAGNDLKDFVANPPRGEESPVGRFLAGLLSFEKPLIAAVDGVAIGVGSTMLLHCDFAYAGEGAMFRLPFVDLGLIPEAASSLILPGLAGRKRASELFMLCEPFGAEEAKAMGLINAVTPAGGAEAAARETARRIAEKPPGAVRMTKALMTAAPEPAPERMRREMGLFGERLQSPELAEAVRAFFEKRAPDFSKFT